jgi:hypothetical protein
MRTLLLAILLTLPLPALAQPDGSATDDVMRISRLIAEMRELLTSRDADIREAAIRRAFDDPNSTIRGMAVSYALRRYDPLLLHFALPEGSSVALEDLPSMALSRIKWSDDGRSFTASGGLCGAFRVSASAQVTADRLRLQIGPLCFSPGLLGNSAEPNGRAKPARFSGCQAELAPNKVRDAMEGRLHCPGLPTELPLTLPLG